MNDLLNTSYKIYILAGLAAIAFIGGVRIICLILSNLNN